MLLSTVLNLIFIPVLYVILSTLLASLSRAPKQGQTQDHATV